MQCLVAILRQRNHPQALWLSELGSYLDGYGQAPSAAAETKRVGHLLRSLKWNVKEIEMFLLDKAGEQVHQLKKQGKAVLCLWDGRVLEKAESEKLEGWCPVLSSKAKWRGRTKRGMLLNWPALRPVRVMGMQWTAAVIMGMQGPPTLALNRWWSTRGVFASRLRETEEEALSVVNKNEVHNCCMSLIEDTLRGPGFGSFVLIELVLSFVGSKSMSFGLLRARRKSSGRLAWESGIWHTR